MPRTLIEARKHDTVIALDEPRGEIADAEPTFLRRRNLNSSFVIETSHARLTGFGTLGVVKHVAERTPSVCVRKRGIEIVVNPEASSVVETIDIDYNIERLAKCR